VATEEEYYALVYEVKGAAAITEAQAKLAAVEATVASLSAQFAQNNTLTAAEEEALRDASREAARLRDEITALTAIQARAAAGMSTTAAAMDAASRSAATMRQRMTGLSYSFNDFFGVNGGIDQRLNSLANNLPQMFANMTGRLAGLGLGLSAIVPIIAMIIKNWGTFGDALDSYFSKIAGPQAWERFKVNVRQFVGAGIDYAEDRVKGLDDKIKELTDKPHKLSVDYQDLEAAKREANDIKAALAALESLKKTQGGMAKESGEAVKGVLGEAPGGARSVLDALKVQRQGELLQGKEGPLKPIFDEMKQVRADIDDPKKIFDRAMNQFRLKQLQQQRAEVQGQITAEGGVADQQTGKLVHRATEGTGEDQVKAQQELAARLKKAGRADVAQSVELSSPAKLKEYEEVDAEFDRSLDALKETNKGNKAKRKKNAEALAKVQKAALADLQKSDVLDPWADETAAWAKGSSKDLEEQFEKLKKRLAREIGIRLRNKGVDTRGAEDEIDRAAATEADQALGRVGRLESKDAKAAAKAAKGGKKDPEVERMVKAEDQQIKAGGFVPQVEAALAQAKLEGGAADSRGRFHRLTEEQQFNVIRNQVASQLKRLNPRMDEGQRDDLATKITAQASSHLEKETKGLMQQGLGANEATMAAMQESLMAYQKLVNEAGRQRMMAQNLGQAFRAASTALPAGQGTAQNSGRAR
jgi:hypothetical protein